VGKWAASNPLDALTDRFHIAMGSIKAGNKSIKLKQEVSKTIQLLHKQGVLKKEEKQKIFTTVI